MPNDDTSKVPLSDRFVIDRRDFLNGVAIAVGASFCPVHGAHAADSGPDPSPYDPLLARGITQEDAQYYPPALEGMRGSHPGSFETAHEVRDEKHWRDFRDVSDTGEHYDLVVVGGGISGLAAAYFFRKSNPRARILILDNHDDFGGHAKRNEFETGRRLLLGYGGTQSIEAPSRYSPVAKALLKDIGIYPKRFYEYYDRSYYERFNTLPGIFFDRKTFGVDRLIKGSLPTSTTGSMLDNFTPFSSPECIAQMPISPQARADLHRLCYRSVDYMPEVPPTRRRDTLIKTSYRNYLLKYARVHPDVVKVLQQLTHDLFCVGIDAVSAEDCRNMRYPGFLGMKVTEEEHEEDTEEPYIFHFPDGNASVARLLVRALIPDAMPGHSMEDVVMAKADYPALDRSTNSTRIRLNCTAVAARHVGAPSNAKEVDVFYVYSGRTYKVRASGCIMACYNCMVPYLCPEMPEQQKAALSYSVKEPLVYTNVQLRNWRAFHKLGVHEMYLPGAYFSMITLDYPVSIGAYKFPASPDDACVLHLQRTPCKPGLSNKDQYRAGRWELYTTPFPVFEEHIRDLLERILSPGGFNSARDIEAITVNRWPHGYAYEYNQLFEPLDRPASERPCVIGRQPFGRITIANSDSGGAAYTDVAIDQGHRAAVELAARMAGAVPQSVE
ncbi:MAG: NAD(P)/FAD-dependent oxidoreductase [Alphaproteobacteria bacterium]|nr:NAD(P)/FAD-dependent oxidoreductase [Alphaproteobacteria bacterium]